MTPTTSRADAIPAAPGAPSHDDSNILAGVSALLQAALSFEDVLRQVLRGATECLGAERAELYMLDDGARVLVGRQPAQISNLTISLNGAAEVLSATVLHARPQVLDDLSDPGSGPALDERLRRRLQAGAFTSIPLVAWGRVIGVLTLHDSRPGRLLRDKLPLFNALAAQARLAIERARLYEEREESIRNLTLLTEKLQASEKRWREFMEESPDGIVESTPDGRILWCNRAISRILGYSSEELLASDARRFYVDPVQRDAMVQALHRDGRVEGLELLVRRKDGGSARVNVSSRLRRDSGEPVLESIVRDVTEKHEMQHRVTALTDAVTWSADAIVSLDDECRVTSWNPGAEKTFGYTQSEMLGRPYRVLVPEDLADEFSNVLRARAERDGRVQGFETVRLHKDGRRVPVSVTATRLRHNGGPGLGWSIVLRDITESRTLAEMSARLNEELGTRSRLEGIIGNSGVMEEVRDTIRRVARFNSSVLLVGSSGTGKEIVSNAIHYISQRRERPFIKVNCAAIPEDLLESELFGIERNVATGVDGRIGRFEMADGGTLFLDEIGDMSLATQAKILRVLQEREFERVGGKRVIKVDVRIIAATNKNLEAEIEARRFRNDLYYRLNVIVITLPPLANRREDIDPLIDHFLEKFSRENSLPRRRMSLSARMLLNQYDWPGNVRELEHCIERAVVMSEGAEIGESDLPPGLLIWKETGGSESGGAGRSALSELLLQVERRAVLEALERCGWVQAKAARMLRISERSMWYRVKKLGLQPPD
ncbi:MAG TPA: sigma 54-interacting transcriptional regulator [Candidatus Polarisedimenticolia bacterium]|nr:sigma 54-interacting transcriptional regulator [Candidatus Polarisedimenticolia bacterium]